MFNNTIDYLLESRDLSLHMQKLDFESLHFRLYADASLATSLDHTSQLRYIVLLCGKLYNACVVHYTSYKSHRVARSVLGAETYAFAEAYGFAYCSKRDLECILGRTIPLEIHTDSKSLFEVTTKFSETQERLLMIDLQAAHDACKCHQISNVSFIRWPNNPANAMNKRSKCTPLHD